MSTRSQREKGQAQNTNQVILSSLLKEDANRCCSDCGAKGPRWASWNLGVFLCIRCAGIHRNLGVHISKVKSVNLDSWTPEQMASIQEWGNRRAGLYWECFLPKDFNRPQTNSAVESFVRNKYEHKKYSKKDGLPPKAVVQENTSASTKSSKTDKVVKRKKLIDEKKGFSMPANEVNNKVAAPTKTIASVSRPKPQAQTSKPAAAPVAAHAAVKSNPPSLDLLSLDTPAPVKQTLLVGKQSNPAPSAAVNELIDFGSFQGAPQILSQSPPSQPQQLANMSQSAPPLDKEESLLKDDSSTNKSTKDSIMALYTGSGSAQQPQMYGVPGGMYIQPQPQMQKNPQNMYNTPLQTPYHPQPHVVPTHMQQHLMQHPSPQQQQSQLSQIQQQMQQLKLQKNQQMPYQQPQQQQQQQEQQPNNPMYSKNMFTSQQAMNSLMTQQQAMHYQQQQQSQFINTGPSSNMLPMNGMPSSGHTLNNQLWK